MNLEQSLAQSFGHGPAPGVHVKFVVDAAQVVVDRVEADAEAVGDLLLNQAFVSGEMIFPENRRFEIPFFFPGLCFRLFS